MHLERSSNYKREMELLVGSLDRMAVDDPRAAIVVAHLNKVLTRIKQGDWKSLPMEELLMRKTYTIDLKIDFDDAARHKTMLHIVRKNARLLLTQATLIADNRQPQVGITSDDFFEGGTKEGLMDLTNEPEDAGDGIVNDDNDE